ncbi:MAG: hypothetical protein NVS3B8_05850 [Chitinophagaceae bacterium]
MLHVNEDINDELFRKAAENYFIGADNPDWETVLNKMNTGDATLHETVAPQNKKHSVWMKLRSWKCLANYKILLPVEK